MTSNELKRAIAESGRSVASIARQAGIPRTTLYSFMDGASNSLRADAHNAVERVLAAAPPQITAKGTRAAGRPFASNSAPVSVAVPSDLAEMARAYDLDIESLISEGGLPRLREAFKAAYIKHNREGIEWAREYVQTYGTPSEQLGIS